MAKIQIRDMCVRRFGQTNIIDFGPSPLADYGYLTLSCGKQYRFDAIRYPSGWKAWNLRVVVPHRGWGGTHSTRKVWAEPVRDAIAAYMDANEQRLRDVLWLFTLSNAIEVVAELAAKQAPAQSYDTVLELSRMVRSLTDLLEGAVHTHIYDTGNGDVIPADCPYTAAVAQADELLARVGA